MKYYNAEHSLSYHAQELFGNTLEGVFGAALDRMGSTFMQQIYNDLPELFSQQNNRTLGMTIYKAELFVITREEADLLQIIQQERRGLHGIMDTI